MTHFKAQLTRRVVPSAASNRGQVLVTVGLNDVDHQRVAGLELPLGEIKRVGRLSEVFRLIEAGVNPVAILFRYHGDDDPTAFLRILRHHHVQVPVYVVCGTALEAAYFGAERELGPVIGLVEPLDGERLKAVEVACAGAALMASVVPAEGKIDDRGLASLMVQIQAQGVSGVLHLERGETTRRVYFSRGEPVYAESNLLAENFGRQLRARGVIGDVEYEWAQRVQAKEGIRQGEALVRIGALTRKGLYALLRDQIHDKIVNAFVPGETEYRFEAVSPGSAGVTSRFELNLVEILVSGLYRTRSKSDLALKWSLLSEQHLVIQRIGQPLWRAANPILSSRFLKGIDAGRPVAALFGVERSVRERLALMKVIELGRLGFPVPEPPEGVYAGGTGETMPERLEDPGECPFADDVADVFLSLQGADHYGVLGVEAHAGAERVKAAYDALKVRFDRDRAEAKDLDSDLGFQLEAIHRRIDEAWAVLGNEDERAVFHEQWARSGVGRTQRRSTAVDAESAFRRGTDALRQQRLAEAIDGFRAAQKLNPGEPLFRLYEGWALVLGAPPHSPQWLRGRQLVDRALGTNPLMADGYYFIARCLLVDNEPDAAVDNLRMALRLDADHGDARSLLTELAVGDASDVDESELIIDIGED